MKIIKAFLGVPDGHVYPIEHQPGDECPPELEAAAVELGAVEIAPENKAAKPKSIKGK
jgi:hypothetical protein